MSATTEPQLPLDSQLLSLLQSTIDENSTRVAGESPPHIFIRLVAAYTASPASWPHSFIHLVDAYSASPADLVSGRTGKGDGSNMKWYFLSPAHYQGSKPGESKKRRHRMVPVGGTWHTEKGKIAVLDAAGVVGYKRFLYYISKILDSTADIRLGWCMKELCLNQEDGPDQLVICVVYKSPRANPAVFTEASSSAVQEIGQASTSGVIGAGLILDDSLDVPVPDRDIPSAPPPPASWHFNLHSPGSGPGVAREPALSIAPVPNHQRLWWPGGGILSNTSSKAVILKKVIAASVAAGSRDGETPAVPSIVMKLGRSSIPSAEQMNEIAELVISYPAAAGQVVAVVLSEIGYTDTTNNIFMAVRKALTCTNEKVSEIPEFAIIKQLYFRTVDKLGLNRSIVSGPFDQLEHYLRQISTTNEITTRIQNYLLYFGECTSTKIFFELLNKLGKANLQEWELRDVSTLGRSGSDLTAITIGRALGSTEVQVWNSVGGVFTCDPKVWQNAILVPHLTFDEASELMFFGQKSMQLAMDGAISVRVKNSYNSQALGTLITKTRNMSETTLTCIVLKSNITVMDIEMLGMLDWDASVAKAYATLKDLVDLGIFVDSVANSEGKISFALIPPELLSQELIQLKLGSVVEELKKFAVVDLTHYRSVIYLIGNAQESASIHRMALDVLKGINVEAQKVFQGSSKVAKISLMVHDDEARNCVKALHVRFFENGSVPEVEGAENECPILQTAVASSSGVKRKADAPPGGSQDRTDSDNNLITGVGDNICGLTETSHIISDDLRSMLNDLPDELPPFEFPLDDFQMNNGICNGFDMPGCSPSYSGMDNFWSLDGLPSFGFDMPGCSSYSGMDTNLLNLDGLSNFGEVCS